MMFKRLGICAVIITLAAAMLAGCGIWRKQADTKVEPNAYARIQKALTEMQSYKSSASVEYISNKGSNVYDVMQACRTTGEYRVEVIGPESVSGNVTISDGVTIYQFNQNISGKVSVGVKENQERSEIFVTSFVRNYLSSQEVSVSVSNFGEGKCTVLEAIVPGEHPYLSSEKLWVDNETLKPVKLCIYDPDGSERIVVVFKTFDYNVELDDELFSYK